MFVFSSKDIRHIIDTTITNMEPTRSKAYKPVPAYILFLAARFAHYFSSSELLDELLEAASSAITKLVRVCFFFLKLSIALGDAVENLINHFSILSHHSPAPRT